MGYFEEISEYIDQDRLIGNKPHPEKWSNGNPILDSAIATALDLNIDTASYLVGSRLYKPFQAAVARCRVTAIEGATYDKNPGRIDEITHDDMIGVAFFWPGLVYDIAQETGWVFSNTGELYGDAWVRPWHRAYYCLVADKPANPFYKALFCLMLLHDGLFNRKDSSGKKLCWLMLAVKGRSNLVDRFVKLWLRLTRWRWGSMKNVFATYYGADHPFAKYCDF